MFTCKKHQIFVLAEVAHDRKHITSALRDRLRHSDLPLSNKLISLLREDS